MQRTTEKPIDVKEWLWRYRNAKLAVQRLQGEYDELISIQESVGTVNYDGMPHGSGDNHDLSDLMIVRDRMLTNLIRAKHRMTVSYDEITDAISHLDNELKRSIISLRYVQPKHDNEPNSLSDVADLIKYEYSYVRKVHGEALLDLRIIIPQIAKTHKKEQKVTQSNKK